MTDLTPTEAVEDFMAKLEAGYEQVDHLIPVEIKSTNPSKTACCVLGCWMLGHGITYELLSNAYGATERNFYEVYPALSDYNFPDRFGNDVITVLEFIWQTSDGELHTRAGILARQSGIDKRRAYDREVIDHIGLGLRGLVTDE